MLKHVQPVWKRNRSQKPVVLLKSKIQMSFAAKRVCMLYALIATSTQSAYTTDKR